MRTSASSAIARTASPLGSPCAASRFVTMNAAIVVHRRRRRCARSGPVPRRRTRRRSSRRGHVRGRAPPRRSRRCGSSAAWTRMKTSTSVRPSASAPPSSSQGTWRNRSGVVAAMIGMIIAARTRPLVSSPSPSPTEPRKMSNGGTFGRWVSAGIDLLRDPRPEGEGAPHPDHDARDAGEDLQADPDPRGDARRELLDDEDRRADRRPAAR